MIIYLHCPTPGCGPGYKEILLNVPLRDHVHLPGGLLSGAGMAWAEEEKERSAHGRGGAFSWEEVVGEHAQRRV